MKKLSATLIAMFMVALLSACEGKLARLTDHDLAERHSYCLDNEPTAPGKAQACSNIARECERRKEELGTYICRHR